MSEEIQEAAAVGAGKAKKSVAPEVKDRELRVARAMVKAIWAAEWTAENPKGTSSERMTAWKAIRIERMQAHLKTLRSAVRQLEKQGMILSMPESMGAAED